MSVGSQLLQPALEAPRGEQPAASLATALHTPRNMGWMRRLARRLMVLDLLLVGTATVTALVARFGGTASTAQLQNSTAPVPLTSYVTLCFVLSLGWLVSMGVARAYDGRILGVGGDEYKRVAKASMWIWGVTAIVCYLAQIELARGFVAVAFPAGTILLLLGRWGARKVLHHARRTSAAWSHRVLVVGGREEVRHLVAELRREPYAGLHVVGACVPAGTESAFRRGDGIPVVGTLTSVPQAAARMGVDTIAVTASRGLTSSVLKRLGWELEGAGVDIVVAPALTDVAGPRVHVRPVSGLPLLYVEQPEFTGPSRVVKEVFDRLFALVALLLLAPAFLAIAVAVKLTSPGPVIFRQTRVGRDGDLFTVYKFRTMVVDAEQRLRELLHRNESDGALFKLRSDPRVTTVGRWLRRLSLDELPQLANVLKGDMSLV
ncbi:MAG TPA: exopolysaccharide biosynthesis polyprenyl glycosylphosphotransferase, partial [Actinomycetes bacterium]